MTLHDNDGDNEKNDDGDDDDANDDGDDDDDGEEPTCTHHGYSSDSPSQEITVIIDFINIILSYRYIIYIILKKNYQKSMFW